jgi:hypothetical protein
MTKAFRFTGTVHPAPARAMLWGRGEVRGGYEMPNTQELGRLQISKG